MIAIAWTRDLAMYAMNVWIVRAGVLPSLSPLARTIWDLGSFKRWAGTLEQAWASLNRVSRLRNQVRQIVITLNDFP